MKNSKAIIGLIILLVAGGLIIFGKKAETPTTIPDTNQTTEVTPEADIPVAENIVPPNGQVITVTYGASGFSPATVSINAGDTVKFINNTEGNMWVASDPHPQHTNYSAFDARTSYTPSTSYSFIFTEKKTYTYHDHLHPNIKGTVIVK